MTKRDPSDPLCECGNCGPDETFECPGCLTICGYCMGGSASCFAEGCDEWQDYCSPCWWQLSQDLTTVVIQPPKPDIYQRIDTSLSTSMADTEDI